MPRNYEKYIGLVFGKLRVTDEYSIKKDNHSRTFLTCECFCGNIIERRKDHFNKIKNNSDLLHCGCLYKNEFEIMKDYIIGKTRNGEIFCFSLEDYDDIINHLWHFDGEYISTNLPLENGKIRHLRLHVFLMFKYEIPNKGVMIDHEDRNKMNYQRYNLRITNTKGNTRNQNLSHRNKSGVIGVFMPINRNKWESRITVNRKVIILGHFENFKDAVTVRLTAEKEYFGDFAPQKHLFEEYGII